MVVGGEKPFPSSPTPDEDESSSGQTVEVAIATPYCQRDANPALLEQYQRIVLEKYKKVNSLDAEKVWNRD